MEQFIQILVWIWDALNSDWFWGLVALIGAIYFLVVFFRAERAVDQYRAEIQKDGKR